MKILLVNQTFAPDKAATAQYFEDFARALLTRGHQVSILCSRQSYLDKHARHVSYEDLDGLQIFRVSSPIVSERVKIARVLNALFLNIALALRFLRLPDFDRVICGSSPPLLAWFIALINICKPSRLILFCMDLNPDQVIAAGWISTHSRVARWLRRAMGFASARAAKIWCLDREMKERLSAYTSHPECIEQIDLWWDAQLELAEGQANGFRHAHGIAEQFVIMYSGNHSLCHPLDILLQAALTLRAHPDFLFVFVGGGPRFEQVRRFKEEHELQNILQFPYQERAELGLALRAADLLTVSLGAEYSGIVHPCKFYSALAVKRAVVCFGKGENFLRRFARESAQIHYFDQDDLSGFLELILLLQQGRVPHANFDAGFESLRLRFSEARALDSLIQRLELS